MPKYQYTARDSEGNKVDGIINAPSSLIVVTRLRSQNLFPIKIYLAGQSGSSRLSWWEKERTKRGRVNLKELSLFTRQTAAMLDAGVAIVELLDDLSYQTPNRYFSAALQKIKKDIQEGSNLSGAISRYPKIFPPIYIALIKAGEESGNIAEVLAELAANLEGQLELISKVKQAVSYPFVVSLFFLGVIGFVFLFLLPKFQEIFSDFGAKLPAFTLFILAVSKFLVATFPYLMGGAILLIIALFLFYKTPTGRLKIDTFKLKFPVFGPLMLKVSFSRLASSLATLLSGGVTIVLALDIVAKTAGNAMIEQTMDKIREGVIEGSLLGTEMKKYRVFPILFVRMVTVGEETGKIEEMLYRVSKFFQDEVDATLNVLASILEPFLIISLGAIVGVVVFAIYMPIFNLATAVR
ncbi:type II secretion system F family protein [bacterium]|nr:type II secretion system F family protein [bacterium]